MKTHHPKCWVYAQGVVEIHQLFKPFHLGKKNQGCDLVFAQLFHPLVKNDHSVENTPVYQIASLKKIFPDETV